MKIHLCPHVDHKLRASQGQLSLRFTETIEKNKRNTEMKEEKRRKKSKRHVAEKEQPVHDTEPKKKKKTLERTKKVEEEAAEELTAEERRTLERKLKKERKKEEKKLMREAGIAAKKEEPKKTSGAELALEYLTRQFQCPHPLCRICTSTSVSCHSHPSLRRSCSRSWSKKTKEWKFQKTRQTWLLLHMYEKEKVPDEYFSILLDYLEGLKGSARDVTMQKAEALMKEYDNSDTEDPGLLEKCERIRKVLQLLS
ncbi:uncharacterized protein C7orf50 homolog isoform X1 [Gopherus flavomarginatus]|uniref:uncharacterized protein C7orf50 homolog isoform X1 n=2 Tax=Gopherus flavomarginatus TaxID=286002 RepID=UPI0021CC1A2A|nr:uncharacterized protein C7orf50 homolog isoform X1 [Gopherus flavomarginatus]